MARPQQQSLGDDVVTHDDTDDSASKQPDPAEARPPGVWCIVANVRISRRVGPGGAELRSGTKHFAPGAKVYVIAAYWGRGAETVTVVGRHRKSHRYLTISLQSAYLTNWRVELIYSPTVLEQARVGVPEGASSTSSQDRERVDTWVAPLARDQVPQPFTTRSRQQPA